MDASVSSAQMKYQGVGKRFVATFIDGILMGIVGWIIALAVGGTTSAGFELTGAPAFVWLAIGFCYFFLMEGHTGATLGKMALGMRVVKADGSPCDLQASLIRNLLRIVDGLFVYLVGAILVWTSQKRQRLGDRVARTVVVSTR